jgi:hypothetical protein
MMSSRSNRKQQSTALATTTILEENDLMKKLEVDNRAMQLSIQEKIKELKTAKQKGDDAIRHLKSVSLE